MNITHQDLRGHRALVTGASSGIGEHYARQLAARGADLVIAARRIDRLHKLRDELAEKHGVRIECYESDLEKADAPEKLFIQATDGGRQLTMVINNAGIGPYGRFLKTPHARHSATIRLNTVALTELSHLAATHMIAHGKPSYITNVGSIASFNAAPGFAVYSGTKNYVRIFSQVLRHELAATNVSITCLCPGGVYTEFLDANGQTLLEAGKSSMMSADEVVRQGIEAMLARTPIIVPGWLNKIAVLLPRFLPMGFAIAAAEKVMARSVTETRK